jgi:hypothetical protein
VFLYFALLGRFSEFFESVFVFNANYSGSIISNVWKFVTSPVLVFHEAYKDIWFLVLSALAWIFISRKEYGVSRLGRWFFILVFLGLVVELSSPGPLAAILSALFFTDLRLRLSVKRNSFVRALPALLALLVFINLGYYQARYLSMTPDEVSKVKHGSGAIDIRVMAEYVEEHSSPCEEIYVWGGEAGVYYYADRRSASGIFFIFPLYFDTDEGRARKLDRIYSDITTSPPALFIRSKGYGTLGADSLFQFVERRYRVVKSFNDVDIYELKSRGSKPDCGGD